MLNRGLGMCLESRVEVLAGYITDRSDKEKSPCLGKMPLRFEIDIRMDSYVPLKHDL